MRGRYVYIVFTGPRRGWNQPGARFAAFTSRRRAYFAADVAARDHDKVGTVKRISWGYWRECGYSMDAPTAWMIGEQIAEFGTVTQ